MMLDWILDRQAEMLGLRHGETLRERAESGGFADRFAFGVCFWLVRVIAAPFVALMVLVAALWPSQKPTDMLWLTLYELSRRYFERKVQARCTKSAWEYLEGHADG